MTPQFITQVPPAHSRRGERVEFVELLKTRPGHWALYKPGGGHSLSGASQFSADFPGVEVHGRKSDTHAGYDIYARWIGMNGDQP